MSADESYTDVTVRVPSWEAALEDEEYAAYTVAFVGETMTFLDSPFEYDTGIRADEARTLAALLLSAADELEAHSARERADRVERYSRVFLDAGGAAAGVGTAIAAVLDAIDQDEAAALDEAEFDEDLLDDVDDDER